MKNDSGNSVAGITRFRLTIVACLALMLSSMAGALFPGCGVKSAPVPPQMVYPAAIFDLHASAHSGGINLTWSRPMHYVSGHSMRDLGGFVLLRGEGNQQPFKPLAEVPVTDQERFSPQRTYSYLDRATLVGNSYRYAILARTLDGYTSALSNQVEFTRRQPRSTAESHNLPLPAPSPPVPSSP
jgi:hypothetical protein